MVETLTLDLLLKVLIVLVLCEVVKVEDVETFPRIQSQAWNTAFMF